jgi:hypothetical protein
LSQEPTKATVTVAEAAKRAAKLLKGHWTQGRMAKDKRGAVAHPYGMSSVPMDKPVCWCALGALYKIGHDLAVEHGSKVSFYPVALEAEFTNRIKRFQGGIPAWNDVPSRTEAEVIKVFKDIAKDPVARETVMEIFIS